MRPYMTPYKGSEYINVYIPQKLNEHTHQNFSVIYHKDISEQSYPRIRNWNRGMIRCD
jgi:hypothetical protein